MTHLTLLIHLAEHHHTVRIILRDPLAISRDRHLIVERDTIAMMIHIAQIHLRRRKYTRLSPDQTQTK